MIVILAIFGFVVALFVIAAVIDLKARRRGVRYTVGDPTADPKQTAARAEATMRDNTFGTGYGGGF
jgi:hypothetical protein